MSNGSGGTATREKEIPKQLNIETDLIESLTIAVESLGEALNTALQEPHVDDSPEEIEPECCTIIGNQLRVNNACLKLLVRRVSNLTERLEV